MVDRSSGRGSTSEITDLSGPNRLKVNARKVNESLYELKRQTGTPEMELLFFHGLQSEDESDAHLRTWESEDGSSLWPQNWLAEEFPAARILCVAYNGSVRNSSRSSFDMHNIVENLISDFMQGKIGQTPNCPVVLIGHCFGGLVIKQLCLEANIRKHVGRESERARVGAFFDNVKGVVFYGTPHHGIPGLMEASELVKNNQLLSFFETLSKGASRLDFEFTQLRQDDVTWLVGSLGEDLPADRGILRGLVAAPEGTARTGDVFNLLAVDHQSICKPKDKTDKRFYFLTELLHIIARNSQVVLPIHEVQGLPMYPLDLERRALVVKEKLIGGGILGMCGMGGIGKTTLAKQTFNMISKYFEYTCFVDNVKGIPSHDLQNRVLNQFHHNGRKSVQNSTQWSDLRAKKVLIAMDDVDGENQLRVLPKLEHFVMGSCIIITSRNREVFKYYEKCTVYEVDLLEEHDAEKLICRHAFGSQEAPEFLTDQVDAVVNKCGGLPLTLEVIGKYLQDHGTNADVWTETLHRLTEAQAITGGRSDRVWASLRISYDALLPDEQEMFTEAALFFFEEPLDDALAAWSTATQTKWITWRNLVNKSLVKEINKRVWVHEHLRDLAHNISKEIMVSGTDDEANSAVDLLNDKQVEATTKCLRLKYSYYFSTGRTLELAWLAKLKGLKYMDLDRVQLGGWRNFVTMKISLLRFHSLNPLTSKMSYLRFHSLNMSKFKFSLNKMQNLAVLELSNFRIRDEFPDALGKLTNLRILRLYKLEGFDHLPENFGNLARLRRLEVSSLKSLTLPQSFGNLRALEHLFLDQIRSLVLPESLGHLSKLISNGSAEWTGLKSLSISCGGLATLPASFSGLKSLQELKIRCPKLKKLPESLGELSLLKTFSSNCPLLEKLPDTFGNLWSLEELSFSLPLLELLPEGFGGLHNLRTLTLQNARKLKMLPENFVGLVALQQLRIDGADELQTLPDNFSGLESLQEMTIESRSMVSLSESFGGVHHLRTLKLWGVTKLKMPENFGGLLALQELEIDGADELQTLPDSFSRLESLQKLTLSCARLERLPNFSHLKSLRELTLDCSILERLPENFGTLSSLQELSISSRSMASLPESVWQLHSLKKLRLVAGTNTRSLLDGSRAIASLTEVDFDCDGLEQTPDLFDSLRSFAHELILGGSNTRILPTGLGCLSSLRTLTLRDLGRLETLPDELGTLSALERLTINYCPGLKSLPDSLGQLSSLKEVSLLQCNRLETLPERWGKSGGIEVAAPEGDQREERRAQGEESSHTKHTEALLLKVRSCPLLDQSMLESLGWMAYDCDGGTTEYRRN